MATITIVIADPRLIGPAIVPRVVGGMVGGFVLCSGVVAGLAVEGEGGWGRRGRELLFVADRVGEMGVGVGDGRGAEAVRRVGGIGVVGGRVVGFGVLLGGAAHGGKCSLNVLFHESLNIVK